MESSTENNLLNNIQTDHERQTQVIINPDLRGFFAKLANVNVREKFNQLRIFRNDSSLALRFKFHIELPIKEPEALNFPHLLQMFQFEAEFYIMDRH